MIHKIDEIGERNLKKENSQVYDLKKTPYVFFLHEHTLLLLKYQYIKQICL